MDFPLIFFFFWCGFLCIWCCRGGRGVAVVVRWVVAVVVGCCCGGEVEVEGLWISVVEVCICGLVEGVGRRGGD